MFDRLVKHGGLCQSDCGVPLSLGILLYLGQEMQVVAAEHITYQPILSSLV
jgi:hypothetical protein